MYLDTHPYTNTVQVKLAQCFLIVLKEKEAISCDAPQK